MGMPNSQITSGEPVLKIENLSVAYQHEKQVREAVRDFALKIEPGQTYGLVGESGSGKTTVALSVMRYLGKSGAITKGSILFKGKDLLELDSEKMRQIWGAEISLVPQNPLSSLNPSIKVGDQLGEIFVHHDGAGAMAAQRNALELLEKVHIPDAARIAGSYPHQISGGMRQRVLIAMAIALNPGLLILDEPTTSLDVTTEAVILDLIKDLIEEYNTSTLYVTHNLGVVAQICDRVAVLYAGELVEDASLADLFARPLHPYTIGLLKSVPQPGASKKERALSAIPGQIPALGSRPDGCIFEPRCPLAVDICLERPSLTNAEADHMVRCHRWEEIHNSQVDSASLYEKQELDLEETLEISETPGQILSIDNAEVYFDIDRSILDTVKGEPPRTVKAVDEVSLKIPRGKTIGLVGESGSGKTTIARAVVGLQPLTGGQVQLLEMPLPPELSGRDMDTLKQLQMVFQNPEGALNPNMSVGASLKRPIMRLFSIDGKEAERKVAKLLESVKLSPEYARRMPYQLSGGEKQRVAIARAFVSNPELLIADEPVSSLDVSVQAAILNMLDELQGTNQTSMLFISHDLAVVGYIADIVAVIYLGKFMEISRSQDLFSPPHHPYTEALLSAVPLPDPEIKKGRIRLEGDIPSPVDIPSGCRFHTRCPRFIGDICVQKEPPIQIDPSGNQYYCHISLDELLEKQGST